MIDKIINTIKEYRNIDPDVLIHSAEQKAEMDAEIAYLEKMKDFSYIKEIEQLKARIDLLQDALIETPSSRINKDRLVSRKDFIEIYNKCVSRMFDEDERGIDEGPYGKIIYEKNTTIHWNGMYCDCSSGAIVANEIIPTIQGIEDEEGEDF